VGFGQAARNAGIPRGNVAAVTRVPRFIPVPSAALSAALPH